MKLKNLFFTIFVMVLCAGFTACSSDDDDGTDYAPGIAGTYDVKDGTDAITIKIEATGTNQIKLTTSAAFTYAKMQITSVEGTATTSQGTLSTSISGTANAAVLGMNNVTAAISGGIEPITGMGTINIAAAGMTIPLVVTRVAVVAQ